MTSLILFESVVTSLKSDQALVKNIKKRTTKRLRPQPLNTIELQKQLSRKLHLSSAQVMEICEKLYNKGYLSYPRTETNKYSANFNLKKLVEEQKLSDDWGDFASKIADGTYWKGPRNGTKDDGAHPPIHPIKLAKK